MNTRTYSRWLVAVTALLLAGCGDSSKLDRRAVTGVVTVNGTPLTHGHVVLTPVLGTIGPAGSAAIEAGQFELQADVGLVPGEYRVEIQSRPEVDFALDDDVAFTARARQQRRRPLIRLAIPSQFNSASTLTAVLPAAEESSSLVFDLKFKLPRPLAHR